MMKNIKNTLITAAAFLILIGVAACKKNNETAHMTVKMTDEPGDYDTVNVEILEVQVHYSNDEDDESGWVTLATEVGNYDLLLLQDGVTTILSEDVEIPVGKLQQMRLILGSNNYVVIEEEIFPLALSSQDKTGLKLNLNTTVAADDEIEITFDFDADKSINETGSGTYKLKPVLKVVEVLFL